MARSADPAAEKEIRDAVTAFDAAWNKGDLKGVVAMHTDDAVVMNPAGLALRGRAEIEKGSQGLTQGPGKVQRQTTINAIKLIKPDVAAVDQEVGIAASGGAPVEQARKGRRFLVMVKKDGKWLISDSRSYFLSAPLGAPPAGKDAKAPPPPAKP